MGDYLSFNTKRRRRKKKKATSSSSTPETFPLVHGSTRGEFNEGRSCMPSFKRREKSPSVPHTEDTDDWEDHLLAASTNSEQPLLHDTIHSINDDEVEKTSMIMNEDMDNHMELLASFKKRRGRSVVETPNDDKTPPVVTPPGYPPYDRSNSSSGRHRRRSPVYEGEQEPQGIRGQEAVVSNVGSKPSLPSMRSFSPTQQSTSRPLPFMVLDDDDDEEEDDDAHGYSQDSSTQSSVDMAHMQKDLQPRFADAMTTNKNKNVDLVLNYYEEDSSDEVEQEEEEESSSSEEDQKYQARYQPKYQEGQEDTSPFKLGPTSSTRQQFQEEESSTPFESDRSSTATPQEYSSAYVPPPFAASDNHRLDKKPPPSNNSMHRNHPMRQGVVASEMDMEELNAADVKHVQSGNSSKHRNHPMRQGVVASEMDMEELNAADVKHVQSGNSSKHRNHPMRQGVVASEMDMEEELNAADVKNVQSGNSSKHRNHPMRQGVVAPRNSNNNHTATEMDMEELNAAAVKHVQLGEYNHALTLFEFILQERIDTYGKVHPLVACARHNLGLVHSKRASILIREERDQAIQMSLKQFQAAARCARDSLGPNHPNVAASLVRIGFLLMNCKEYQKAVITFEEALRIRLVHYGHHHFLVANLYNDLGVCLTHLHQWNEALLKTTLALDTQRGLVFDDQSRLEMADTLCNLGGLHLERMQYEAQHEVEWARHAVSAFCEALDIRQRVLRDPSHPLVVQVRSLHDMAQSTVRELKQTSPRRNSPAKKKRQEDVVDEDDLSSKMFQQASPRKNSPVKKMRQEDFVDEDDLSSRMFQQPSWDDSKSWEDDDAFEIKRGAWSTNVKKSPSLPLQEVMVDPNDECSHDDSLGDAPSPRRVPDGTTKIWVSPHVIPTRSPSRGQQDSLSFLDDPVYQQDLSMSSSVGDQLHEITPPPKRRERTYSYDAEESCLISNADADQFVSFPTTKKKQRREIMVVQPTNTFDEKAIQPLVSRKTICWSEAVHQSPPPNHYDSPSCLVQEQDDTYEFESEADHGGGLAASRQIVITREMMEDPEEHLQEIHCVASRYLKENRLHEAIILFETVLQCQRQKHGELHEEVGAALHNVGLVHLRAERHEEALESFERAVRVRKGALGRDHPDVAVSLVKVGITDLLLHRFEMAIMAFRDALSIRRHSLGSLHPSLARIYSNIGCVHLEFNEVPEARRAFEGALDIQRNALCEEPDSGPLMFGTATTLCNLGYLYVSREMYGKAAVIFKEAVNLQEVVLGQDHPTVLSTLDSLAHCNTKCNNCATALKCYYDILERFPADGANDFRRKRAEAVILYKMSRTHRQQNDRESELEKLKAALVIVQEIAASSGPNHSNKGLTDRLERGIQKDIKRVQDEISKNDLDWV